MIAIFREILNDFGNSGNKIFPEGYEEKIEIEDLQLGMRFHADMLNRVWFVIITLVIFVAFCTTFVQSWLP